MGIWLCADCSRGFRAVEAAKMSVLPNPFDFNSVGHSAPAPTGSAAASQVLQPQAAAAQIQVSDGAASLPSSPLEEMEPGEVHAPSDPLVHINHIPEIFHYVRKLMKQPPRFILDTDAFMAEVEEVPLFVRDGEHLCRWSA